MKQKHGMEPKLIERVKIRLLLLLAKTVGANGGLWSGNGILRSSFINLKKAVDEKLSLTLLYLSGSLNLVHSSPVYNTTPQLQSSKQDLQQPSFSICTTE